MKNLIIAIIFGIMLPINTYADEHMENVKLKIENQILISKAELNTVKVKLKVSKGDATLKEQKEMLENQIKTLKEDLSVVKDAIKQEAKYNSAKEKLDAIEILYEEVIEKYKTIIDKNIY